MTDRKQIRAEVMATIMDDMRADRARGLDPAIEARKRGIPETVATEAWLNLEFEADEAWWRAVERTIEGEVIRRALANHSA